MFNKSKNTQVTMDILTKEQHHLQKLMSDSESAVDLISSTITRLERVNEEIDSTYESIEQYQAELEKTKNNLSSQREKNTRVVGRFKALLED